MQTQASPLGKQESEALAKNLLTGEASYKCPSSSAVARHFDTLSAQKAAVFPTALVASIQIKCHRNLWTLHPSSLGSIKGEDAARHPLCSEDIGNTFGPKGFDLTTICEQSY
jgi:hypothetical protein